MTHPLREVLEFYPTPFEATRALLSVERFQGPIWEPACGDGAIAKILSAAGHTVVATDLVDRGYGTGGINFLAETTNHARHILTNPPFGRGLADCFIRHALALAAPVQGSVAMLLDLAGLAYPDRTPLWLAHPPSRVHILDELICQPAGRATITRAEVRFCWCVWRPDHHGPTTLSWLHTRNFRRWGDT